MFKKTVCLLLALLPLLSCTKDDLTHPVQAELLLEMEGEQNGSATEPIQVTGGRFLISELEFDGYRENGENYFFTKKFPDSLNVAFSSSSTTKILAFEMPQGIYSRIDIRLGVPSLKEGTAAVEVLERVSLKGGVEIWGNYINTKGEAVPFIFIYSAKDVFKYTAKSTAGDQQVVVKAKADHKGVIRFNPQHWMELINARMLQSANIKIVDGAPTIIISKSQNDHIYNLLVSRIEKSTSLSFE